MLAADENPDAQRVVLVEPVAAFGLQRVGPARALGGLADAIEGEIAQQIRVIVEEAVFRDYRDLEIERPFRMQERERAELGPLGLMLVEIGRVEGGNRRAVDRRDAGEGRLAGIIG